jgi:YcxB-like protein
MSENVKLQIKHEEKEYVAAVRAFLARDYGIFKSLLGAFTLSAYILIWLTLTNVGLWIALMPVLMIFTTYISAMYLSGPRHRFRSDPTLKEGFEIEFSDEGISYNAPNITSRMNWDFYSRVVESDTVYVLIRGKLQITVIPKRAFTSSAQEAHFRSLLQRHIPPAGLKELKKTNDRPELEEYVPPPAPPDWR